MGKDKTRPDDVTPIIIEIKPSGGKDKAGRTKLIAYVVDAKGDTKDINFYFFNDNRKWDTWLGIIQNAMELRGEVTVTLDTTPATLKTIKRLKNNTILSARDFNHFPATDLKRKR